jgi:hypothetical protein
MNRDRCSFSPQALENDDWLLVSSLDQQHKELKPSTRAAYVSEDLLKAKISIQRKRDNSRIVKIIKNKNKQKKKRKKK